MNKIAVYPYSNEFDPVLKNVSLLNKEYEICTLVSPKGWRYADEARNLNGKTIRINSELSVETLGGIDTLLITDFKTVYPNVKLLEKTIIDNIIAVLAVFDCLICCTRLNKVYLDLLEEACLDNDCKFINWVEIKSLEEFGFNEREIDFLHEYPSLEVINTPIVAVAGMYYNTNKFEIALSLRKNFLESGYKVAQVGSSHYSELFDFHPFPGFMFNPQVDEALKISLFNRYIKQIEKESSPDVIILSVPGAMQTISENFPAGFALLPYLAFNAVRVDFLVLCTYFVTTETFFEEFSASCRYKFGCPVDCFHVSDFVIDISASREIRKVITKKYDRKLVKQKLIELENSDIPKFDLLDAENQEKLFDLVMEKIATDFDFARG